jgi:hypothetical protein
MLKVTFFRKDKSAGLAVLADRLESRGIQLLAHKGGDVTMIAWVNMGGDWVGCDDRDYAGFTVEFFEEL